MSTESLTGDTTARHASDVDARHARAARAFGLAFVACGLLYGWRT